MPTLSLVMIVKDEAACLADCLASVASIVDEMVVGDTGSTDATAEIARGLGARVIDVPWDHDFAKARNAVLREAKGDWLLHLDADEALDPAGAARLRALIDADGHGADAFELSIANYCDEPRAWRWVPAAKGDPMARKFSGYIETQLLRLFRNGCGFEYREPVHENITESVLEREGVVRQASMLIHHYGYRPNGADPKKSQLYLAIGRRKVEQRPDDPKAWHDLAEQLLAVGETLEAEAACRQALKREPAHVGAATTLANILCNRGDLDDARWVLEGLERLPHVLTALGAIACRRGDLAEASNLLREAVAAEPPSVMAYLHYARALDLSGDGKGARAQLRLAAETAPALTEPSDRLIAHQLRVDAEQLMKQGNHREALSKLVEALKLDPEDPLVHRDLSVVLGALGDASRATASLERAQRLAAVLPAL